MSEKYENAMDKFNGIICALDSLPDQLKEAGKNNTAAEGARTILLALGTELNNVYADLLEFGKGVST